MMLLTKFVVQVNNIGRHRRRPVSRAAKVAKRPALRALVRL